MTDLTAILQEAAYTGCLTALTIWPTNDGKWQCNVRRKHPNGAQGWACVTASDVVAGTVEALTSPTEVKAVWEMPRSPVSGKPNTRPSTKPEPPQEEDIFG